MQRAIVSVRPDERGQPIAALRCGHALRCELPVGSEIDCECCDRFEIPAGFVAYKRTQDFDVHSTPAGLRKDHSTKPGVWGVIHVLEGTLRYIVEPPLARELVLDPDHPGIVVPEVLHRVVPAAGARFYVEFHHQE